MSLKRTRIHAENISVNTKAKMYHLQNLPIIKFSIVQIIATTFTKFLMSALLF